MSTTLTQDIYGVGTHYGTPQNTTPGQTSVTVTGLIGAADLDNPALSLTLAVEVSRVINGQTDFVEISQVTWQGGANAPFPTNPPSVGPNLSSPLPAQVRARLDMNAPGSVGIDQVLQ